MDSRVLKPYDIHRTHLNQTASRLSLDETVVDFTIIKVKMQWPHLKHYALETTDT